MTQSTKNESTSTSTSHTTTMPTGQADSDTLLHTILVFGIPCGVLVVAGLFVAAVYCSLRYKRRNRHSLKEDLIAKYSTISDDKGRLTTIIDFMDTSDAYDHTKRHPTRSSSANQYEKLNGEDYNTAVFRNTILNTDNILHDKGRCIDSAYDMCNVKNGNIKTKDEQEQSSVNNSTSVENNP